MKFLALTAAASLSAIIFSLAVSVPVKAYDTVEIAQTSQVSVPRAS